MHPTDAACESFSPGRCVDSSSGADMGLGPACGLLGYVLGPVASVERMRLPCPWTQEGAVEGLPLAKEANLSLPLGYPAVSCLLLRGIPCPQPS